VRSKLTRSCKRALSDQIGSIIHIKEAVIQCHGLLESIKRVHVLLCEVSVFDIQVDTICFKISSRWNIWQFIFYRIWYIRFTRTTTTLVFHLITSQPKSISNALLNCRIFPSTKASLEAVSMHYLFHDNMGFRIFKIKE